MNNKNPFKKRKIQFSMIRTQMVIYITVCLLHIFSLCLMMASEQTETCSTLDNKNIFQILFRLTVLLFACLYHLRFSVAGLLNVDSRPAEVHNILPVSRLAERLLAPHARLRHGKTAHSPFRRQQINSSRLRSFLLFSYDSSSCV